MAFTDRFVKLKVMLEGPDRTALITHVYINPMTIDAFTDEMVTYDLDYEKGVEQGAVRVWTKHDIHLVLMPIEDFMDLLNSHY
jgi:hypothetical protein